MKWMQIAFFCFLDIIVSALIAQLASSHEKWPLFFISLGVLWLLPILTGLWSFTKFWIGYHLFIKRRFVRYFKAKMHEDRLPASAGFFDHMAYLSHVLDQDFDRSAKNRASFILGELTAYKDWRPFTMGVAIQSSLEAAMEEYRPDHVDKSAQKSD